MSNINSDSDAQTSPKGQFDLEGIGKRPVAFICHSLGGLLVKQALRSAMGSRNSAWKAVADATRLVVFLSTPHSGSDLASWLKHIGGILRSTVTVEELEAHHSRLRELNVWYRDNVEDLDIATFVYFEKQKTHGVLVVNETTADPGIPGVTPIPVDENHVSICKPVNRECQVSKRISRLIEERFLQETNEESDSP